MITFKTWEPGTTLKDTELLLKIRKSNGRIDTGFFATLTKKGELQKSFHEWGIERYTGASLTDIPIYVIEETFRSGWKLYSWRYGQSQNWARLIHPLGFTLEIYLSQFLDVVLTNTIIDGVIQGEFKWEKNHLVKKS